MRTPQPAAVLELLKPVTWFLPMWALAIVTRSDFKPAVFVIALRYLRGRPYGAAAIVGLLQNPRERAPWLHANGVPLPVSGILIGAFALQSLFTAGAP